MNIRSIFNSGGATYTPAAAVAADVAVASVTPMPASHNTFQAISTTHNPEDVKILVAQINKTLQSLSHKLEFTVDEGSKMTVVKVVDPTTKDVIRQFPTQEVLEIAKALNNFQGLLFKGKA